MQNIENEFLAVNHLIVRRKRQNRDLPGTQFVRRRETEAVVMILAVHRVQLHVRGPACRASSQIPLVPEPRPPVSGGRHASVCRLFRRNADRGHLLANMRLMRNSMASVFDRELRSVSALALLCGWSRCES